MISDELYKFRDRTSTGLRTLLDDITKNIQMEYMPKRRWSTLENKRANIMIKAIDKQLKERRIIRSLKKFIGGKRFNTTAGNPVKEILLKLNLPDHSDKVLKLKNFKKNASLKLSKLSYQEKYEHVGPKSQDHKMERLQDNVKRLCLVDDLKKFKITFMSSQRYKSKPKVKDHYNISQCNDYGIDCMEVFWPRDGSIEDLDVLLIDLKVDFTDCFGDSKPCAPVGFAPQWIGGQIPNNNNGWLEEDDEEDPEEDDDEDPEEDEVDEDDEEDPEEDDDEDPDEDEVGNGEEEEMEIDDEMDNPEVIDPDVPPPPVFQFGHNFHVGESSSTRALLDGNSVVFAPGPKPSDLMTIHSRTTKLEKQMFERYNTEIKIKKKFNEDDLRMNRHELDVTIKYSKMKRPCIPKRLRAPRADDPFVMARDAAMAAQEDDDDTAAKDP
ncbi:hypothetical protein Tco_1553964 [Tanacetum coccineum]